MPAKKQKADNRTNINKAQRTVRHENFRSLYLNHLQVGFTRWDFQLVLGVIEVSNNGEFTDTIQETANVKMTPAYAKAFLKDVGEALKGFEEMYGEIPLPLPLDQPRGKPE